MKTARLVRRLVALMALLGAGSVLAGEAGPLGRRSPRVLLLAVDGLDWRVMRPLLLRGEMPHLTRLIVTGASGDLESLPLPYPLRVSATLVTGKPVAEHGIYSFDPRERLRKKSPTEPQARGPAAPRLVTSEMRRVAALWDIASARRLSCNVVGWSNTWPAEALSGSLIASPSPWAEPQGLPGSAYPPELEQRLDFWPGLPVAGPPERLRPVWEADGRLAAAALCLLEEPAPDLFLLQLPGLATVSERFWKYTFPRDLDFRLPAAEVQDLGKVIPAYYRFVDEVLGELLERVDLSETALLLVSGQSFEAQLQPKQPEHSARPRPDGVLVVAGRGALQGAGYLRASVFDIAPTVLRLLGLPEARDMKGRFVEEAFLPELRQASTGTVASYEP